MAAAARDMLTNRRSPSRSPNRSYPPMSAINLDSTRVVVRDMQESRSVPPIVIVEKKPVCNELLCNIMRGIANDVVDSAIIDIVNLTFGVEQINEARRILFKNFYTLFPDDPNGEHPALIAESPREKEIKKKWKIQDILEKMHVVATIEHDIEFCVPWDYKPIIVNDEESRFKEIMKEKDDEIDDKFAALEKVIDKQNRATIMAVETIMTDAMANMKDGIYEKKNGGTSTPVFESAEVINGSADPDDLKSGRVTPFIYNRRIFDIQILNSLIIFCLVCFALRIVQRFLSAFTIKF